MKQNDLTLHTGPGLLGKRKVVKLNAAWLGVLGFQCRLKPDKQIDADGWNN